MKPTYDELEAALAETKTRLAETEIQLIKMQNLLKLALERIASLEEKLKKKFKKQL